jgi:uncharacterized membrane protein
MSVEAVDATNAIVRRTPRWMWVLLILSLALNLMILGIVFGSLWAVRHGGLWDAPIALERSQRFMSGLPQERRAEIKSIFFGHKPSMVPFWREVRQARLAIGTLIKRGTYTEAELNTAMEVLFQKEMAARQAAKPMVADMMAQLKPDERLHFLSVFLPYLDEVQAQPAVQASPIGP